MGVCMALHSQGLLPSVISGSSAGAIIAGIVCSHNDTDLDAILNSESLLELFNSLHEDYTEQEHWLDGEDIRVIVENWIQI